MEHLVTRSLEEIWKTSTRPRSRGPSNEKPGGDLQEFNERTTKGQRRDPTRPRSCEPGHKKIGRDLEDFNKTMLCKPGGEKPGGNLQDLTEERSNETTELRTGDEGYKETKESRKCKQN